MTEVVYVVVEHDGGWAYKVGAVFSEPFPTREQAVEAARLAAAEQELPDLKTVGISYEDKDGQWHDEVSSGDDRPSTKVVE
jgi:hypothetical protein